MMTTTVMALQSDFWNSIGRGVGAMWLYAAVGLVLMVIGFYAIDLTTPGPLRQMVKQGKPNAVVISAAGIVSMAFIVVLAIYSPGAGWPRDSPPPRFSASSGSWHRWS